MRLRSHPSSRTFCLLSAVLVGGVPLFAETPLDLGPLPVLQPTAPPPSAAASAPVEGGPLGFEVNHGQADAGVRFVVDTSRYSVRLHERGAVLRLPGGGAVGMTFRGARGPAAVEGDELLARRTHYYAGERHAGWLTDVPHYARVRYRGLYRGIDAVFREHGGELDYDLVVAPRADPRAIRISFDGVRHLRLAPNGDLVLVTSSGEVRQRRPIVHQDVDGRRREIAGRFVRRGRRTVGFKLGAYDKRRALVIDPAIVHSTYEAAR